MTLPNTNLPAIPEWLQKIQPILGQTSQNIQVIHKKFTTYFNFLTVESNKINLISQHDLNIFSIRHLYDSIVPLILFPNLLLSLKGLNMVDVGSGNGLPGIPLAIVSPMTKVCLLESSVKKCQFLIDLIKQLEIDNCKVECVRAESAGQNAKLRESFDIAMSRAMAKINTALELVLPLIKVNGFGFFWGSAGSWLEWQDIQQVTSLLGGEARSQENYQLSNDNSILRQILKVEKITPTNKKYPRRDGIPKKHPIH